MKRTHILRAVCIVFIVTLMVTAQETDSAGRSEEKVRTYPGYELVWSDEFNKDGRPDPHRWTYERGFVRNEELQWYQPDNARCEDGLLVIESRRQRKVNPGYDICIYDTASPDTSRSSDSGRFTVDLIL